MNSFAPSFYYHDRVEEKAAELAPGEPELDVLTAVEPTSPPSLPSVKYVPVYSTYLHAGMTWNPAYNSLPEPKKAEPLKVEPIKIELKFDESKKSEIIFQQQPVIEQIAPIQIKEEPPKEYKDSIYIGFQDNITPAYSNAKKQMAFVEAPKHEVPKSRFVQPIKITDLPLPEIKKSEEHPVKNFTAKLNYPQTKQIEGEAFHPVKMNAVSEYQFGQLNDLVSYIDLKH